jgi:hypothetical protein
LTQAHWEGQRARYLTPFRIYLLMTALFFALVPAGTQMRDQLRIMAADVTMQQALPGAAQLAEVAQKPQFDSRFVTSYKVLLALSVTGAAFFSWLLFRTRPYGAHLVLALHLMGFLFLITTVWHVALRLVIGQGDAGATGGWAMAALLPYYIYAWKMFGRLFGCNGWARLWRFGGLIAGTLFVDFTVAVGALVYTAWSL